MKSIHTKSKEQCAKLAYELRQNCGYPSINEAIHLIEDGIIVWLSSLTSADVHRAYEIYGTPVGYVPGKTTERPISRALQDDSLIMENKQQHLYTDVMHIDANKFLVIVTDPLQLILVTWIEKELQDKLGIALQGQSAPQSYNQNHLCWSTKCW